MSADWKGCNSNDVLCLVLGYYIWSKGQEVGFVPFSKRGSTWGCTCGSVCIWWCLGVRRKKHILSTCTSDGQGTQCHCGLPRLLHLSRGSKIFLLFALKVVNFFLIMLVTYQFCFAFLVCLFKEAYCVVLFAGECIKYGWGHIRQPALGEGERTSVQYWQGSLNANKV